MSKIPKISGNVMVRYLQRKGFVITQRKGSHATLKNSDTITIVPLGNKILPIGTQHKILSYADISREEFVYDHNNGIVR